MTKLSNSIVHFVYSKAVSHLLSTLKHVQSKSLIQLVFGAANLIENVGPSAAGTGPCSVLGFLGYVGDLAFNLEVGFQLVRSKAYYCASGYSVTVRVIGQLHSEVYISASMKFLETRYTYYIFSPEVLIMSGANQAKILLSQRIRDLDLQNMQSQTNKICSLLSVLRIPIMGLKWQTIYRCQTFLNKSML